MRWSRQAISRDCNNARTMLNMKTILYFSYGSNMSTPRIRSRVSSARIMTGVRLYRHRLKFHKRSRDNSGKCDAEFTNNENDIVHGVVFEIAVAEKPVLDSYEGLGIGYREQRVSVYTGEGDRLDAFTYLAINIDPELKPYEWYKEHVIRGAREHGLPADYIHAITAIESVPDPDSFRHELELSIYGNRKIR